MSARTANASKRRQPNSIKPAVRFVAGRYWRALTTMTCSAFLGGMAEALFLVLVTRAAFAITDSGGEIDVVFEWSISINQALLMGFGLVMARIAFAAFAVWQAARVSTWAVARIRRRLAQGFIDSSWDTQQAQQAGSLQELVGGFSGQASGVIGGVNSGLTGLSNLAAMLALAIAVDPLGAGVMLISVIVFGSALRPFRSAVKRRANAANEATMQMGTTVNEISRLGMELHVFHVQGSATERLEQRIDWVRQRTRRLQLANSMSSTFYSGLAFVAILGALGVVSLSNATSLTSLGAVMLVMLRSLSYGQAVQTAYLGLSSSAPAIDRIIERLAYFANGKRHDGGKPVDSVGPIIIDRITFSYAGNSPALHDISLTVEPREVIGVVGPSGGGKSTLVQLLLGLRDPQEGRILADGREIGEFAKAEWARKVTFVPQAAHLITGTVADNIRFLRDDVTDEQIERASRMANLHDDVMGFPERYDRPVGEQGGHLSGGQQQRLCIARALVEQPDVLILDEPTSALDVKSEHLISAALLELKQRMTVIIIAHRLSTLDICDRIMVIQDGRLVGFDTPERLEETDDFYREALQLSGLR
jgi:ABC-type multidrug transport system fused ATPase/permease subunit